MKIKAAIDRIPGGLMLVPLLLGAILHTTAPGTAEYFGSFTKGIITGTLPILSVWFFCIGASIDLRATGTVLRKSGTLVVTKIAVAWWLPSLPDISCRNTALRPVCWRVCPRWLWYRRWI